MYMCIQSKMTPFSCYTNILSCIQYVVIFSSISSYRMFYVYLDIYMHIGTNKTSHETQ